MGVLKVLQDEVRRGGAVPRAPVSPLEEEAEALVAAAAPAPAPAAPEPEEKPAAVAPTPAVQAALRKKYESSGHTQTMPYEDWYEANFANAGPDEIERAAKSTVRIQAGKDPTLEPGQNSAVAQSRVAAGKPLPEGREASQYSDSQRRTMQRNVHSPEVPMTRFGGTFTHNVDGSVSSRAPNPQMLELAQQIEADPEQGRGSASHTMALAQAFGIDATQYGDDMDLLKADVERERKRHATMVGKYDIEEGPMGGYVYVPSQDMRAKMADRRRDQFAREIRVRHAGLAGPDGKPLLNAEQLRGLAQTNDPSAFSQMVDINRELNTASAEQRARNVRNNWANRNMTIAANNPMVAQGLYMRSLQEASRSGDPMQVAAVHSAFGNDRAASDYMSLAGQQADAAAVVAAGEAAAMAKAGDQPANVPYAEQFSKEVAAAMQNPNPVQQRTALIGILNKMAVVPPDQVEKVADALIMSASGGAVTPEQTRTWWQWLTGTPQTPTTPQQPQPLPAGVQGPALPPTPTTPASGRGGALDATMDFLSGTGPRLPAPNHPYRRGS